MGGKLVELELTWDELESMLLGSWTQRILRGL